MQKSFQKYLVILTFIISLVLPGISLAANFSVTPLIIDVQGDPNEAFTKTIKLVNHDSNIARVFASVNEISVGEDNEIKEFVPSSMSDRTTSVTSWIEITRGRIELKPGEEKEIPLIIRVNPNTPPGLYHALVGFAVGTNRDVAQEKVLNGLGSGVVIRVLVGSKQEEFLRLTSYSTDPFSYIVSKGEIRFELENTGDVTLTPKNSVIIYDSRGRELTSVTIESSDGNTIEAGQKKTYVGKLPFFNRLGKNKAYLSVEYGIEKRAALYDTTFYYSIPWLYLVIIMLLLLIVIVSLVMVARRNNSSDNYSDTNEAHDLPVYVRKVKEHDEYEHDINLKNKN